MTASVALQSVAPRLLAAVERVVAPVEIGSAWGPALNSVWAFVRNQEGLWTTGHNIFLYRPLPEPDGRFLCHFGVEVTRTFDAAGEVVATDTPGGEAAVIVHRGPYDRLGDAYTAIDEWLATTGRESAGCSWEIYGDPTHDPEETETTVLCLLA